MAITKAAAEKTLRARMKRATTDLTNGVGDVAELAHYIEELRGKLSDLASLDGSDAAPDDDKARAHLVGTWCRENHQRHIATCPTSLDNYVRVDPKTGDVVSAPEITMPGAAQAISLPTIEAPNRVG